MAVLIALALVLATGAGVVQACGMTRLRQRAGSGTADPVLTAYIERNALRARALIGALTVALLALGAALGS